jgi:hypothetical protein
MPAGCKVNNPPHSGKKLMLPSIRRMFSCKSTAVLMFSTQDIYQHLGLSLLFTFGLKMGSDKF